MKEEKEELRREVDEHMIDCFCRKYRPCRESDCDMELTIYDIRMFFNLFYVSDPRIDILDAYLNRLHEEGFDMNVSYDGEPTMYVSIKKIITK